MNLEQVIFSVDKPWDFLFEADMSRKDLPITSGHGKYNGVVEPCFMTDILTWRKIKDTNWVKDQICFLHVPGDVRQPCTIRDKEENVVKVLGPMKSYPSKDGLEDWTTFDGETYWSC